MLRIEIPGEIEVGGYKYTVRFGQGVNRELNSSGLCGSHSHMDATIQVHTNLDSQQLNNTVWHEILHAIDAVYCASELTEAQVVRISNGLQQLANQLGITFELPKGQ